MVKNIIHYCKWSPLLCLGFGHHHFLSVSLSDLSGNFPICSFVFPNLTSILQILAVISVKTSVIFLITHHYITDHPKIQGLR